MVVAQQYMVGEDRSQHLRAFVVQHAMPRPLQLKGTRETLVERLYGLAPTTVDLPPPATLEKRPPLPPTLCGRPRTLSGPVTRILRAEETAARWLAPLVLFDLLSVVVHVVAAVRIHVLGLRRQGRDFVREGAGLRGAGGVGRHQQWTNHAASAGRHDHLIAVALHPAVVVAVAPGGLDIHPSRNHATVTLALVPGRPQPIQQTLVHSDDLGVDHLLGDELLPLQPDGLLEKPVAAAVAVEVGAAAGETVIADPQGQVVPVGAEK